MNRYGEMAQEYWIRWLPHSYSEIDDTSSYFSTLGQEIEQEIADLTPQIAGDDPGRESYLDKVGRLNMAKLRAEEIVLTQRVWLTPEPGADPEEEDDDPPTGPSEWVSIPTDPAHPFWTAQREWQQEDPPG